MKLQLQGKILLATLLPIVAGMIIFTLLASTMASQGLSTLTDVQMLELAKKQAAEIDSIIHEGSYLSEIIAESKSVEGLAHLALEPTEYVQSSSEYTSLQAQANDLLANIVQKNPNIVTALVVGKDGKSIAHSQTDRIGLDLSAYASVQKAFRGEIGMHAQKSRQTGKMSVFLTCPVVPDGGGAVEGVAFVGMDLDAVSQNTIHNVQVVPSTDLYLLDQDGILLMDKVYGHLVGEDQMGYEYAKVLLQEKNGVTRSTWDGDVRVIHFAELPHTKWVLGISSSEEEFFSSARSISWALAGSAALLVLLVAGIIYIVIRKIVASVSRSADIASYVAAGNLSLTSEQEQQISEAEKRGDEISTLATALRTLITNLSKMVFESEEKSKEAQQAADDAAKASQAAELSAHEAEEKRQSILEAVVQLEGIVHNIASASEQLSSHISLSTQGAGEQSERMTETATAMEEMNSTVLEVARNSGASAELADATREKAIQGATITQQCQSSMTQVKDESMKLRQNMGELANHAQSINAVMSVISDIADQTNLLALNAAIEAARAGEAGRGFAVVADEVRKLAEKTIASTVDVAKAITSIQQSTETNVTQVDTAVKCIEEATELAMEGGEALQIILEMAEQSADGIRAIATASEEQSATSDEIARSISTVSEIADTTVSSMRQATEAIDSLSEQAKNLTALVESLRNS